MNKLFVYILPLLAFIILTVLRELLDFNSNIYLAFLLIIIISIPFFESISKKKQKISK